METETEKKFDAKEWQERNTREIGAANEKTDVRLFNIGGWVIVLIGLLVATFGLSLGTGATVIALGMIVLGIGKIIELLIKQQKTPTRE